MVTACQIKTQEPNIRVYRERDYSSFTLCPVIPIPKPILLTDDLVVELAKIKGNDIRAQKQTDIVVSKYITRLKDAVSKKNKELEETNKKYWESCYNYDVNKNKNPNYAPKKGKQPKAK